MFRDQLRFVRCGPTRADDANFILVAFRPDDEHQTSTNRTDRQEAVFVVAMGIVEDLEVVDPDVKSSCATSKDTPCFFRLARFFAGFQETFTRFILRQRRTTSMAYG